MTSFFSQPQYFHWTLVLLVFSLWLGACSEKDEEDSNSQPFPSPAALPTGMMWIHIPGGTFLMGSAEMTDQQPVHKVVLHAFEMNQSEVTVAQYRECVNAQVCTVPDSGGEFENWDDPGYENHPVNAVDFYQAQTFCNWVGGTLPSESMWEYAAKSAGKNRRYPWGDEPPNCTKAVMDDDTHSDGCGTNRTWPVCSKPEGNSDQGLCDMSGNLWEWVRDWYHGTYDCVQDPSAHNCEEGDRAPTDGSAWDDSGVLIVERGGSFNSDAFYLRTSMRLRVWPTKRSYGLGFRCSREVQ